MHERRVARDLLERAIRAAEEAQGRLTAVELVIGPLSGYSADGLRTAFATNAMESLGYVPAIDVQMATETLDAGAAGVLLRSIGIEA